MRRLLIAAPAIILAVAACSSSVTVDSQAPVSASPSQAVAGAHASQSAPSASTMPATPAGPKEVQPGQTATVNESGTDTVKVMVDKVKQVPSYEGSLGADKPQTPGDVFIQAMVHYTSLDDSAMYNPFDWQVFADGSAVQNFTVLMNGPKPELGSGPLPKGRQAGGYVVYEVPAKGKVVMSYEQLGGGAPLFDVVLRAK